MCRAAHEIAARYACREVDIPTANRYTMRPPRGFPTHTPPRTPQGRRPKRRPYLCSLKSASSPANCALTSNAGPRT